MTKRKMTNAIVAQVTRRRRLAAVLLVASRVALFALLRGTLQRGGGTSSTDLSDLPLTEIAVGKRWGLPTAAGMTGKRAARSTGGSASADTFAVFLSGDGGWAAFVDDISKRLASEGMPVVGLSSFTYFGSYHAPDAIATDLGRIVRHYAAKWKRHRVVLLGFSFGANVLPFTIDKLDPTTRAVIIALGLISPAHVADFKFSLSDWLFAGKDHLPIGSAQIAALATLPVACLYGLDEKAASLCTDTRMPKSVVTHAFPGDHHLNQDTAGATKALLERVPLDDAPRKNQPVLSKESKP